MKKIFLSLIASVCCALSVSAQEYVEYPYAFIGVRGGAQTILLPKNGDGMKITPSAGINVGTMITPVWGARLDFTGVWNKLATKDAGTIDFNSLTGDLDVLFNLTNALRDEKYNPFNFYVLAGAGFIGEWGSTNYTSQRAIINDLYNIRAGVIADYRLSKTVSANLELDGNYMTGAESEVYGNNKWKLGAYLGLTFKLPYNNEIVKKTAAAAAVAAPVTSQSDYDAAAAAAEAARLEAARKAKAQETARRAAEEAAKAAAVAEAAKPIDETIFFTIGQYDSAETFDAAVKATAEWCKKHTDKTVTISGYADKGTGTAAVNKRVAKNRATAVADAIKAQGVSADQLKVDSFGDKVQPFSENDKNRCVIISGK